MMTEERLQYFLDDTSINEKEYHELVEDYFKADKIKWFKKNKWDEEKVAQFWQLIRKRVMLISRARGYYDFSQFVFPKSGNGSDFKPILDYWEQNESRVFEFEVNFTGAEFMGEIHFQDIHFKSNVSFLCTSFLNNLSFSNVNFSELTVFEHAEFLRGVTFNDSNFLGNVNFQEAKFVSSTSFWNVFFEKQAWFGESIFSEDANFINVTFLGDTNFFGVRFSGYVNFSSTKFSEALFQDFKEYSEGCFVNVNFPNTVIFRRIDLTKTKFLQADIINVQFKECNWGNTPRIILQDEFSNQKKDINYYKALESLYRQLIKNFDSNKDWELSSKAYMSEMEMRKRRYRLENEKLLFSIYWVYAQLGFAHDIKRPFYGLLGLFIIFTGVYFFIDYNILWAMQRSIYASLPKLITIPNVSKLQDYWLIPANVQSFLALVFLTFFILALRKRFR